MNEWPYSPYSTTFLFSLPVSIPFFIWHLRKSMGASSIPNQSFIQVISIGALLMIDYLVCCAIVDAFAVGRFISKLSISSTAILIYFWFSIAFVLLAAGGVKLISSAPTKKTVLFAVRWLLVLAASQVLIILLMPFLVSHVKAIYFFH